MASRADTLQAAIPCPACGVLEEISWKPGTTSPTCGACDKPLFPEATDAFLSDGTLDQCPACGCAHLFRQKDFNRALGVGLVVVGIALAGFTYGISLVIVAAIDLAIYRLVGEVACCYRCGGQFRGLPRMGDVPPFQLPLHDYYRNLTARRGDQR